jgi:hypothetical protein
MILKKHGGITPEMGFANYIQNTPSFALYYYQYRSTEYLALAKAIPELFQGAYVPDQNGCTIICQLWSLEKKPVSAEIVQNAPASALQAHTTPAGLLHNPVSRIYFDAPLEAFRRLMCRATDLNLSASKIQYWNVTFTRPIPFCGVHNQKSQEIASYQNIWSRTCKHISITRQLWHHKLCHIIIDIPAPLYWIVMDYIVLEFPLRKVNNQSNNPNHKHTTHHTQTSISI